jgi:hypothetical protein
VILLCPKAPAGFPRKRKRPPAPGRAAVEWNVA